VTPDAWVFVGRMAVLALVGYGLRVLLDRHEARQRRRGIAPPHHPDPAAQRALELRRRQRRELGLLPPEGDWCGCCGHASVPGGLWCEDCLPHVTSEGPPHERTWYATHEGEDCPYADHWDGELPPGVVEETRLMPGAEQRDYGDEDQVPEGLGIPGSPVIKRAYPSRTTPLELLPKTERELWREAVKASL